MHAHIRYRLGRFNFPKVRLSFQHWDWFLSLTPDPTGSNSRYIRRGLQRPVLTANAGFPVSESRRDTLGHDPPPPRSRSNSLPIYAPHPSRKDAQSDGFAPTQSPQFPVRSPRTPFDPGPQTNPPAASGPSRAHFRANGVPSCAFPLLLAVTHDVARRCRLRHRSSPDSDGSSGAQTHTRPLVCAPPGVDAYG